MYLIKCKQTHKYREKTGGYIGEWKSGRGKIGAGN